MLSRLAMTNESMTLALKEAYAKAAEEVGAEVSAVGTFFHEVYTKHPEVELYYNSKIEGAISGEKRFIIFTSFSIM